MELLQLIVLAIVQGITEFLPISSSAHLILIPSLTDWQDQGVAFDVALHVGSLMAVLWYFRHDLVTLWQAWWRQIRGGSSTPESRLVWAVLFGTIPVGLCGLLFVDLISAYARQTWVIASATIVFGLLLWLADWRGQQQRDEYTMTFVDVFWIGLAQALALIPGTSRSGATMTAALLLGFTRTAAARFSFLLSIPTIILAGGLETQKLINSGVGVDWFSLSLGALLSAISAYACIYLFIKLLDTIGMMPFVIYRLMLGTVLFLFFVN